MAQKTITTFDEALKLKSKWYVGRKLVIPIYSQKLKDHPSKCHHVIDDELYDIISDTFTCVHCNKRLSRKAVYRWLTA